MKRIQQVINWCINISKVTDKSLVYILLDFLKLRHKASVSKEEYMKYQLYDAEPSFRETFLSSAKSWQVWAVLNPEHYACMARDKYMSHCLLTKSNIPTSSLYLYYNPQLASNTDCQAYNYEGVVSILQNKQVTECVIKLSQDSAHGEGVIVCHKIDFDNDTCRIQRYDGTYTNLKDILADSPLLFESLIKQNAQFSAFNSSSVNTIRMMTALYPNNTVQLFAAFIKIGRSGSDVDNAGAGGNVDVAVDIESGRLYNAIEFNSWQDIVKIHKHPDSNAQIEGEYINNWKKIVSQVSDYQARIPQLKVIGWDVALTDKGPVIIEINNWWDTTGQLFTQKGWKNEVLDCYNAWKNLK